MEDVTIIIFEQEMGALHRVSITKISKFVRSDCLLHIIHIQFGRGNQRNFVGKRAHFFRFLVAQCAHY